MPPTIDTTCHTRDHRHEVIHQFVRGVGWKHHLERSPLHLKKLFDVNKAKTGQPIPKLHNNLANVRIGQQLEQFWAGVIHARCNFLHNLGHLIAPTCRIRLGSLNVSIKVCFLSLGGDTCIQGYSV
jgi:hypothetical protein